MTKTKDLCTVRNVVSLYLSNRGGIDSTLSRKDISHSIAVGPLFQAFLGVVNLAMAFLLRLAVVCGTPLGSVE